MNFSAQININIREPKPPSVIILVPETDVTIKLGETIYLIGEYNDTDGEVVGMDWYSSIDGYLGSDSSLNTTLSKGLHNVSFNVTDNDGLSGTDHILIEVQMNDDEASEENDDHKSRKKHIVIIERPSNVNQNSIEEPDADVENESDVNQKSGEELNGINKNAVLNRNQNTSDHSSIPISVFTTILDLFDFNNIKQQVNNYMELPRIWILMVMDYF